MFIFKRPYIDLINELEYCNKWNIVYIINFQISHINKYTMSQARGSGNCLYPS